MNHNQDRPHSQPSRQRRTISADLEEYESDARAYRYFMATFADNMHALAKTYRDCLGDFELVPRIKISREEQQYFSEQSQKLFNRFSDKLSR